MRTFKHNNTGRNAEQSSDVNYLIKTPKKQFELPKEMIEGCTDREEVIEKEWIYELVQFIKLTRVTEDTQEKEYREYIEKHMPRIRSEELENIYDMSKDMPRPKIIFEMKKLLRSKGLLAD